MRYFFSYLNTLIVYNSKRLSTFTAPGRVTSFEIKRPSVILTTMEVSWSVPLLRERNGIIKEYKIDHNISRVSGIYSDHTLLILAILNIEIRENNVYISEASYMYILVHSLNKHNRHICA